MNNTQNPSAIRSKHMITEALLKLMNEHPYQEITVKQIILETDLVRKTFYRNFSSKDDVLDSIITKKIEEYANESLQDIREQVEFERQLEAQRMAREQQDSEAR